ncbi:MAG: ABC transporter ATP-binding protein [bacterium]
MKKILEIFTNSFKILSSVWEDWGYRTIVYYFLVLLEGLGLYFVSYLSGQIINQLGNPQLIMGYNGAYFWMVVFILTILAIQIFFAVSSYLDMAFFLFLQEKFGMMIVDKKSELDIASQENPKYSDLIGRVTENNWRVNNFTDRISLIIFNNIPAVFAQGAVLLFANPLIFLIFIALSIPEFIVQTRFAKRVYSIEADKSEVKRRYWETRSYFDNLEYLTEFKIYQNAKHFSGLVRRLLRDFRDKELRNDLERVKYVLVSNFFSVTGLAIAVVFFVNQVMKGEIPIGTFVFYLGTIQWLRRDLTNMLRNLGKQMEDSSFVTELFNFLSIAPDIASSANSIKINHDKSPEIIFENVSFKYPGTENYVLNNLNFKIKAGEKMALVGVNGAGKTTLVKLICRFYDPTEGRILINGIDLKEVDLPSWYKMIGILFQDYPRYHSLVKDAISISRAGDKTDVQKIKDSAKAAEADIFIDKWEKNYDQMLGRQFEGGVEPSVGQWQKLGLARTFYRDPKVMILDEPTSSIDAESEAKIFEKIESIKDDRTTILISHRFSTVRKADGIIVIKDGKIIENGTHDELIKKKKVYYKLFNIQAKGYKK